MPMDMMGAMKRGGFTGGAGVMRDKSMLPPAPPMMEKGPMGGGFSGGGWGTMQKPMQAMNAVGTANPALAGQVIDRGPMLGGGVSSVMGGGGGFESSLPPNEGDLRGATRGLPPAGRPMPRPPMPVPPQPEVMDRGMMGQGINVAPPPIATNLARPMPPPQNLGSAYRRNAGRGGPQRMY